MRGASNGGLDSTALASANSINPQPDWTYARVPDGEAAVAGDAPASADPDAAVIHLRCFSLCVTNKYFHKPLISTRSNRHLIRVGGLASAVLQRKGTVYNRISRAEN